MRMIEIVVLGCFALVCVSMVVLAFCYAFGETKTFMAIDEKIAEIIRGEKNGTCRIDRH